MSGSEMAGIVLFFWWDWFLYLVQQMIDGECRRKVIGLRQFRIPSHFWDR